MFDILDIGASGLAAQRVRMDTIAQNVASMNVTVGLHGENAPFRRRLVYFAQGQAGDVSKPGVHVAKVVEDPSPFNEKYEPGSKLADAKGFVKYPNVDPAVEMVNMIDATRSYEANVTMMETAKSMFNSTLRLLA